MGDQEILARQQNYMRQRNMTIIFNTKRQKIAAYTCTLIFSKEKGRKGLQYQRYNVECAQVYIYTQMPCNCSGNKI